MLGPQQGLLKEGRSQLALKDFPSHRRGRVGTTEEQGGQRPVHPYYHSQELPFAKSRCQATYILYVRQLRHTAVT